MSWSGAYIFKCPGSLSNIEVPPGRVGLSGLGTPEICGKDEATDLTPDEKRAAKQVIQESSGPGDTDQQEATQAV